MFSLCDLFRVVRVSRRGDTKTDQREANLSDEESGEQRKRGAPISLQTHFLRIRAARASFWIDEFSEGVSSRCVIYVTNTRLCPMGAWSSQGQFVEYLHEEIFRWSSGVIVWEAGDLEVTAAGGRNLEDKWFRYRLAPKPRCFLCFLST